MFWNVNLFIFVQLFCIFQDQIVFIRIKPLISTVTEMTINFLTLPVQTTLLSVGEINLPRTPIVHMLRHWTESLATCAHVFFVFLLVHLYWCSLCSRLRVWDPNRIQTNASLTIASNYKLGGDSVEFYNVYIVNFVRCEMQGSTPEVKIQQCV